MKKLLTIIHLCSTCLLSQNVLAQEVPNPLGDPYLECINICSSPKVLPENFQECYTDCIFSGGNCIPQGYGEEKPTPIEEEPTNPILGLFCVLEEVCEISLETIDTCQDLLEVGSELSEDCSELIDLVCEGVEPLMELPAPRCYLPGYGLYFGNPQIRFRGLCLPPLVY